VSDLSIALVRALREKSDLQELCEHTLARREIEAPEPRGFVRGHSKTGRLLEFLSNPLNQLSKEHRLHNAPGGADLLE
jgi:hypothetical protein